MLRGIVSVFLAIFLVVDCAAAADPLRLDDPDRFSSEVVILLSQGSFHDAAVKIVETMGKQEVLPQLETALKIIEGKKFDFTKKVIDKDFNGALRQIIHYAYLPGFGFVYFTFNYKMTSQGWMLTFFNYKDANNELFPAGFVQAN
jgi:hypothetical protein